MSLLYPQFLILFLALVWMGGKNSKNWMLYLSLALMIVALSRPVLTEQKVDETQQAKEIIIALDVSYSMRADDIKPTRLEYAKELIEKILLNNKNEKYSLFAFTTNPLILSPSTTDHKLLLSALHSLKVDNILTHGTDFQTLFDRISKIKTPVKNLLLFTDGGDALNVDIPKDLRVFAVGMASSHGSMLSDSYGKNIKDSKGDLVITRLNPNLKTLANSSGGFFMAYDEVDMSLDFIGKSEGIQKEKVGYKELFWIPLLLALTLFWFQFVSIPKKILVLIPFLTLQADASLLDWYYILQANRSYQEGAYKVSAQNFEKIEHKTMQSQMNLANSYYQVGNFKKAKSLYASLSSTTPQLKKIILYKLGNCSAKLKEYDAAKRFYQKALAFGNDEDIVYNLKLIAEKKQKQRRDFPVFKSEDKAKDSTPQGSKKQKSEPKGSKKVTKTGMGSKASGQSSKTKSSSQKVQPSKLTRPMGFKAYELINKGYISEKNPW
jgi:Ca-activated chloride channel family protein